MVIDTSKATGWVWDRLGETSTWRGIVILLTCLGIKIKPSEQENILVVGLSIVGLINTIRSENKKGISEKANTSSSSGSGI